jgi:hypothetical protein
MSTSQCPICGQNTTAPFVSAISHFRPIDWEQRCYIRGNFKTFGFWSGLRANLTLLFPFINTVWNWKYRKDHLSQELGS